MDDRLGGAFGVRTDRRAVFCLVLVQDITAPFNEVPVVDRRNDQFAKRLCREYWSLLTRFLALALWPAWLRAIIHPQALASVVRLAVF